MKEDFVPLAVQDKRFGRRQRSKEKKRHRNVTGLSRNATSFQSQSKRVGAVRDDYLDVAVPVELDLVNDHERTVSFVRSFLRTTAHSKNRVRLVFSETKAIRPDALLVLLAYLHRARILYGADHVTGTYPTSPRIERAFEDTGFFSLLGVKPRPRAPRKSTSIHYIRFISGETLATDASRRLREALLGDEMELSMAARKKLYRAVSEAMLNVVQHAYPDSHNVDIRIRKKWWLVGSVDRGRDQLQIMFCDLGVGISNTLPKLYTWEKIRSALALLPGVKPNDGEMIQAAMIIGRTKTGQQGRGRGLNDLRRFVELATSGELKIFSRAGVYTYQSGGNETVSNSLHSLGGTLIKWTVPLSSVTNWSPDSEVEDEVIE